MNESSHSLSIYLYQFVLTTSKLEIDVAARLKRLKKKTNKTRSDIGAHRQLKITKNLLLTVFQFAFFSLSFEETS